eukprot:TRINITY_DN19533_c0_g1_i2.p1 TRINITY_DN19533_c0_g1~~TRINITY_DN19533_c0_g1_i2.p1  ORF type:complete len:1787 (+),score=421.26 TRINITY_DN19533_c0_g1_i2:180-5540(+)
MADAAGARPARRGAAALPRGGEWTLRKVQNFKPEMHDAALGGEGAPFDPRFRAYYGELASGVPHGSGIAVTHEGSRYGGEWHAGHREGRGVYDGADGTQYDGEWRKDLFHGRGKRTYQDGTTYIGEWREGQRHGTGAMSGKDFKYDGGWERDLPHGPNCRFKAQSNAITGLLSFGSGRGSKDAEVVMRAFLSDRYGNGMKEYEGPVDRDRGRTGRGRTEYRNGDCYTGEYEGNKRHGKGRMTYDNGDRYDGGWRNDMREGEGVMQFASGGKYDGQWLQDMKHGRGLRDYHNGDRYIGGWERDEISGTGTMHYRNEDEYEGEWKHGKRHGQGEFRFKKQGCVYKGPMVNGLFHTSAATGLGRMQYSGRDGAPGDLFVGSFVKGERTKGIMWLADGSVGFGEWRNDKLHGKGLMWYANGDFYYGHWVRELRQGLGCIRYAEGGEYAGEWDRDRRHGRGTLQRPDGTIAHGTWEDDRPTEHYDGEWRNALFAGIGRYSYRCGSEYDGLWVEGVKHVSGAMRFADGGSYKGGWCEDAPGGSGVMRYPNGGTYSGEWRDGRRHGLGLFLERTGAAWRGRWEEDDRHGDGILWDVDPEAPQPGAVASAAECRDLVCVQGRWDHNRLTGAVIAHFPNGRALQCEYFLGAERSAALPRNPNPGEPASACHQCKGAFGMTRWRYVCPGCLHYFCGACAKACEAGVPLRFVPFEAGDAVPGSERLMDGKACASCAASCAEGCSVCTVWEEVPGLVYCGMMRGGRQSGWGTYWTPDGGVYVGQFKVGTMHGAGNHIAADGEEFFGHWARGKRHGRGFLRRTDGTVEEGEWADGVRMRLLYHGEMQRTTVDGTPGGLTCALVRHGTGKAWYADQAEYNGMHVDGKRHGGGVMRYANGDLYVGHWEKDLRHGTGRLTTPNGVYTGHWRDDKRHGEGCFRDAESGRLYEGIWLENELEGLVLVRCPGGSCYVGVWAAGAERVDVFSQPKMVDDSQSDSCASCAKSFNMFRRRHHCRGCGALFCDDCCGQRREFPKHFGHSGPQRTCKDCDDTYTRGQSLAVQIADSGAVLAGSWRGGRPHGVVGEAAPLSAGPDSGVYAAGAAATAGSGPPPPAAEGPVVGSDAAASVARLGPLRVRALRDGCESPRSPGYLPAGGDEFVQWFDGLAQQAGLPLVWRLLPELRKRAAAGGPPPRMSDAGELSPRRFAFDPSPPRGRQFEPPSRPVAPPRPPPAPPKPDVPLMPPDDEFRERLRGEARELLAKWRSEGAPVRRRLTLDPPPAPPPGDYSPPQWNQWGPTDGEGVRPERHTGSPSSVDPGTPAQLRGAADAQKSVARKAAAVGLQAVTAPARAAAGAVANPAAALSSGAAVLSSGLRGAARPRTPPQLSPASPLGGPALRGPALVGNVRSGTDPPMDPEHTPAPTPADPTPRPPTPPTPAELPEPAQPAEETPAPAAPAEPPPGSADAAPEPGAGTIGAGDTVAQSTGRCPEAADAAPAGAVPSAGIARAATMSSVARSDSSSELPLPPQPAGLDAPGVLEAAAAEMGPRRSELSLAGARISTIGADSAFPAPATEETLRAPTQSSRAPSDSEDDLPRPPLREDSGAARAEQPTSSDSDDGLPRPPPRDAAPGPAEAAGAPPTPDASGSEGGAPRPPPAAAPAERPHGEQPTPSDSEDGLPRPPPREAAPAAAAAVAQRRDAGTPSDSDDGLPRPPPREASAAAAEAAAEPPGALGAFAPGAAVEARDLSSMAAYNGRRGRVVRVSQCGERLIVDFAPEGGAQDERGVRPANLLLLPEGGGE